jgi:hypothetical protein
VKRRVILDLADSLLSQLPELHGVEQRGDLWTNLFTTNVKGVEEMACPTKSCSTAAFVSHKKLKRQKLGFDVPFTCLELQ